VQPKWGIIRTGVPAEKAPKIHEGLKKAESSILTQIRTGRIGLASFLNRAKVPDFPTPMCQCGRAEETASHIIAFCPRFITQRDSLTSPPQGRLDIRTLVDTPEGAKRVGRWFLKLQILPQFRLAEELMREEERKERLTGWVSSRRLVRSRRRRRRQGVTCRLWRRLQKGYKFSDVIGLVMV